MCYHDENSHRILAHLWLLFAYYLLILYNLQPSNTFIVAWCMICRYYLLSVSCWVHDVTSCKTYEVYTCIAKCTAESQVNIRIFLFTSFFTKQLIFRECIYSPLASKAAKSFFFCFLPLHTKFRFIKILYIFTDWNFRCIACVFAKLLLRPIGLLQPWSNEQVMSNILIFRFCRKSVCY